MWLRKGLFRPLTLSSNSNSHFSKKYVAASVLDDNRGGKSSISFRCCSGYRIAVILILLFFVFGIFQVSEVNTEKGGNCIFELQIQKYISQTLMNNFQATSHGKRYEVSISPTLYVAYH
jgi:hypothetical protein